MNIAEFLESAAVRLAALADYIAWLIATLLEALGLFNIS